MAVSTTESAPVICSVSENLSDRVKALRVEYFSFNTRTFRNEVMPFSTGTPWDTVYSITSWSIVPEMMPFLRAAEDSLAAAARVVPLPEGFWDKPLVVRRALFFGAHPQRLAIDMHFPHQCGSRQILQTGSGRTGLGQGQA